MNHWFKLHFFRNERGALSIEFAGVFIGLMLVVFLTYDFYAALALQGKLDRVTYSAASVFRERNYFYSGYSGNSIEDIDVTQVEELEKLISVLLQHSDVELKVDAMYITDSVTTPGVLANSTPNVVSMCGQAGCSSNFFNTQPALSQLKHLAVYSSSHRWVPLYRISACIASNESLFKKISNTLSTEKVVDGLCSSSIVISRCIDNCKFL